jgi:hypothetical protein
MTYAMWGIVTAMALMFTISLYRYRQSLVRRQEIRWMDEHHMLDRLRKRLGL